MADHDHLDSKDMRPCDACGGATNPTFFRVTIENCVVDQRAVQALVGTAAILGGAFVLAQVMSPCDPMATVATRNTLHLCTTCFCTRSIPALWELGESTPTKAAEEAMRKAEARAAEEALRKAEVDRG